MIKIFLDGGVTLQFNDVIDVNLYNSAYLIFSYKDSSETGAVSKEATFDKEKLIGYSISEELT